ncbi:MAG: hypothetical protein AB7H77_10300 [Bdellovibrionales bacterium]
MSDFIKRFYPDNKLFDEKDNFIIHDPKAMPEHLETHPDPFPDYFERTEGIPLDYFTLSLIFFSRTRNRHSDCQPPINQ